MHQRMNVSNFLTLVVPLLTVATATPARGADAAFMNAVDLERFRLAAVQHDGRFKTFDTLARGMIRHITGGSELQRDLAKEGVTVEQDAAFTYLDLIFNPHGYHDVRLIYVKKKPVREALTRAAFGKVDKATLNAILKDGRVSLSFLNLPEVKAKLDQMSRDVMTTSKDVEALDNARALADPRTLKRLMRMIPPPQARSQNDRWFSIEDLGNAAPQDSVHAGMMAPRPLAGMNPEQQQKLTSHWSALETAWRAKDAAAVNAALSGLSQELAAVAPQIYPPPEKLSLEVWYYKYNKMMWSWMIYLVAVVLLLMGVVYRWPRAITAGTAIFGVAFLFHTTACGIRWYLAGRIPNSNMFEAVTAAAWFGGAMAIFLELGPRFQSRKWVWTAATWATIGGFAVWFLNLTFRRIPYDNWQDWGAVAIAAMIIGSIGCMALISLSVAGRMKSARGLAYFGASAGSMVALMCGQFMKNSLDSDISNRMPVLNDLWLYVHTNMIIASYMLIAMAFVVAALYLVGRMLLTGPEEAPGLWLSMIVPTAVVPLPALLEGISIHMIMAAWSPFLVVWGMYIAAWITRLVWRSSAERAYAAWEGLPLGVAGMVSGSGAGALGGGGAGSAGDGGAAGGGGSRVAALPASAPNGGGTRTIPYAGRHNREGLARVFDGATMLLLELSFITLWTGIIMGAVWADHSWGRPWGWDPKEVFALNTWIIFLILVHVRLKVVDKELWTAVLAVIGTSVMLFNWIVVNFFITGLHSYA
ncbi:MAG: hypothetical protein AMXMBFR13_00320 [Phycisphaerae bacterium]